MKRLIAILLALVFIFAMLAGCQASENTDTDIPVGNMDVQSEDGNAPSDIIEVGNSTVAENATDKTTENTITESVPQPTTAKETSTKKAEPTTKKETTTKKKETTTQKSTTTKPAETTAKHTHNWTAHYAERKVLVKEAWDEAIYETNWHTHGTPYVCTVCGKVFGIKCDVCGYTSNYSAEESSTGNNAFTDWNVHLMNTNHNTEPKTGKSTENIPYEVFVGYEHHDAEYKTEKYIDYYTCSCGETKKP